jgi:outer membrane protein OmpA-like peptidoglycan-associated protein
MRPAFRIAIVILLANPAAAMADTICREIHADSNGPVVQEVASPAFLITQGCDDGSLHLRIRPPQLALRWSAERAVPPGDLPPAPSAPEAAPQPSMGIATRVATPVIVLFSLGSSELTAAAQALLDGVQEGSRVSVTDYACVLGSSAGNLELSQRRAEAVAAHLQGRGILAERVEGRGECCPASDRLELNRRVEIQPIQEKEQG